MSALGDVFNDILDREGVTVTVSCDDCDYRESFSDAGRAMRRAAFHAAPGDHSVSLDRAHD